MSMEIDLINEMSHRPVSRHWIEDNIDKLFWTTSDLERIALKDMTDAHLQNCINMKRKVLNKLTINASLASGTFDNVFCLWEDPRLIRSDNWLRVLRYEETRRQHRKAVDTTRYLLIVDGFAYGSGDIEYMVELVRDWISVPYTQPESTEFVLIKQEDGINDTKINPLLKETFNQLIKELKQGRAKLCQTRTQDQKNNITQKDKVIPEGNRTNGNT